MEIKVVNSLGKPWDFPHTQRMERLIFIEIANCKDLQLPEVIEISGLLLKYEKIGNYLYDILLDLFDKKNNMPRIKNTLKELVGKIHIYDFVVEIRNIISGVDIYGTDVLSSIMRISGLIIQAYNLGRLEGVISKSHKVAVSDSLDPFDLSLLFVLEINRRKHIVKRIKDFKSIYDTDAKRYMKYLLKRDHYELIPQVNAMDDHSLIEIANNAGASMYYSYTNNLFNEIDEHFYPQYDLLETAYWERENTGRPSSPIILLFKLLIESLLDKDVLRNRKFYVREKGVKIVFENPVDEVVSIELREVHIDNEFDEHYLSFFYKLTNDDTRMFYLSMKDIQKANTPLLYEKDASVCMMVLAWLGILDSYSVTGSSIKKVAKVYEDSEDDSSYESVAADINNLVSQALNGMSSSNYYFETPTQWNYKTVSASSNTNEESYSATRLIRVGRYMRRLPEGQKPSAEALALAKKFYIDLKEGYTLVDEFDKVQRVKK